MNITHLLQHISALPALRVGVIMGGMGPEREVSFNSGRTIVDYAQHHLTCVPLFHDQDGTLYILPTKFLHRGKISDFQHRLKSEAQRIAWSELSAHIDVLYIALHGRFAEDGTIQGMLDLLGIPYVGSGVQASVLGIDKSVHKPILAAQGIAVAQGIILDIQSDPQSLHWETYPVIVKPACEGSSLGISYVTHESQLVAACLQARHIFSRPQRVLIEEYLQGIEFTCTLIQELDGSWHALGITQIERPETGFWDYRHKYMPGLCDKWTPARISVAQHDAIVSTCVRVAQIVGMRDIARIDGFLNTADQVIITDPNTLSGSAPSSPLFAQTSAAGITPAQLIQFLVYRAYTRSLL